MKISGSHTEEIKAISNTTFRINEEATITATVAKLTEQGKHVINIIHGTPTTFAGTIYKSITFLWEADNESREYLNYINKKTAEEKRMRKQKRLMQNIQYYEKEIRELKIRIERAENPAEAHKTSGYSFATKLWTILCILFGVEFFIGLLNLPYGICAVIPCGILLPISIKVTSHYKERGNEEIVNATEEHNILESLKQELQEKEELLEKEKEKYNKL